MTQLRSAVRLYSSAVHRYSYFRVRHSSTRGAARVVVGLLSSSQSDRLHGSVGSGNSLRAGPFVWAVAGVNEKCLFGFPLMGDEDRCSDAPAFASSAQSERVSADDRFMACSPCVAARYSFSPNLRFEGVGAYVSGQRVSLPSAGVCFTLRGEKGWDLKAWWRLRYSQLCLPFRLALSIYERDHRRSCAQDADLKRTR